MTTPVKQPMEEKIEEDFLFFLEHFKESFDAMQSECDKELCKKWLDKLAIETYKTTKDKQARNIYLSQLVLNMNDRHFKNPFHETPKPGPLRLDGVFNHITTKSILEVEKEKQINENKINWMKFVKNRELEVIDLNHLSNDGRTYVACKTLAEGSGLFAYVAVTMGGNTNYGWVNACGQPIPPPVIKPLDLRVEVPDPEKSCCLQEDKVFQITAEVRSILSKRRPEECRTMTYEFFQRVYGSIEQEMLREEDPNSTACHDPYVEALLEKLINDSKCTDKWNPKLFKRIKMLSMLKKRVKNILRDIEERNKNLEEIEIASTTPMINLTNPAANCSNSMSEMMWQGALMVKPTTKMADALAKTYPVCVVKMLLALMARERRKIINQLQEKQEKHILAMKKDLLDEIKRGIIDYKIARKEWVDVIRVVMHYNKLKGTLGDKNIDDISNSTKGDYLQETIRKEISDTNKRLEATNAKNEKLEDDICELNKNLHEMMEKMDKEQVESAQQMRILEEDICNEKKLIANRTLTIENFEKMLKEYLK